MTEKDSEVASGMVSWPASHQQSRGRLVLQLENFVLANKVVVVSVFEVHSTPDSPPESATRVPFSIERTSEEVPAADGEALASVTGFYVTAIDELENEYSLYVSKQKAAYLHRTVQNAHNNSSSDSSSTLEMVSVDDLAASIIAHLDIIGNRHRDIGKLACREPQVYVAKKARVMPTKSASVKQRNIRTPTKRQDQRAARSLLIAVKVRAAVSSGRRASTLGACDTASDDETLTPRTRKARKSSEYRLLSRMAVADSKTVWKSELEAIHDDPSYRAMMDEAYQKRLSTQGQFGKGSDAASSDDGDRTASLSMIKRAVPEKKGKHKELQERRDKGRYARLRITRTASSSAINELALEPNDPVTTIISSQALRAATFEEADGLSGSFKRLPVLDNSSKRSLLSKEDSTTNIQPPLLVGNSFSRQPMALEQPHEPEQFLRRRSDASERRVLKEESVFNEIPGMGVEITTERPKGRGSLLSAPWLEDAMHLATVGMQENERRSSRLLEENGHLRRRSSVDQTSLRKQSVTKSPRQSGTLAGSPSAPELHHPGSVQATGTELLIRTASQLLLPAAPRSARGSQLSLSPLTDPQETSDNVVRQGVEFPSAEGENEGATELFLTTRKFTEEEKTNCVATIESMENQVEVVGDRAQSLGTQSLQVVSDGRLRTSLVSPQILDLQHVQEREMISPHSPPKSARTEQYPTVIEISEEAVEAVEKDMEDGSTLHDADLQKLKMNDKEQDAARCQERGDLDSKMSSRDTDEQPSEQNKTVSPRFSTPRQACWTEKSPWQLPSASPRVLAPIVLPPVTTHRQLLPSLSPTPGESSQNNALEIPNSGHVDKPDTRSSGSVQPSESAGDRSRIEDQQAPLETGIGSEEAASMMHYEAIRCSSTDQRRKSTGQIDGTNENWSTEAHEHENTIKLAVSGGNKTPGADKRDADTEKSGEGNSAAEYCDLQDGETKSGGLQQATPRSFVLEKDAPELPLSTKAHEQAKNHEAHESPSSDTDKHSTAHSLTNQLATKEVSRSSPKTNRSSASSGTSVVSESRENEGRRKSGEASHCHDKEEVPDSPTSVARQDSQKPSPRSLSSKKVTTNGGVSGERETCELNLSLRPLAATETEADSVDRKAAKLQHDPRIKRSSEFAILYQASPQYHKKWGRWLNGRRAVDKVSCLQLEELVLQDPSSETHLVKLGIRYARWSGTSLAAILLLELASLMHENAPRTHEYWNSMGNAHLDLFLRNRKFLPISKFHLERCLQAFSRAFAYMESLADPLLLLRYAICLFWSSGDTNLEKADDVFRELFTKFASFCDKDRLNLLFLRFQTLSRLHMYREAAECMEAIICLYTSSLNDEPDSDISVPSPYDLEDYRMMLMHCQQSNGDYVLATVTFSTILKNKGIPQESSLNDEQYLELWLSLAQKCFGHEEYPLALEFYSIALNFARDSHVLASIHYSRGLCYEAVHESAKCVAEYKRARNVNRHVTPLVPIADLRGGYNEQFSLLLKKPIRQVIDEVRLTLYDKAVKRLQQIFRQKHMKQSRADNAMTDAPPARSPSFSAADSRARRRSSLLRQHASNSATEPKLAEGYNGDENIGGRDLATARELEHSNHHQRFLARQRVAMEKIRAIQSDPRFHLSAPSVFATSAPSSVSKVTKKVKSMSSESFAHNSGLLSPDRERPELRRKQSMEAFNKLGYAPTTMPCVEYWDEVLSAAADLFASRSALNRGIACIRAALPQVTDTIAYCALAECCGQASSAIEKLHDPSYEREVAYVCTVISIAKILEELKFDGSSANAATVLPPSTGKPNDRATTSSVPGDSPLRFPAIGHFNVAAPEGITAPTSGCSSPVDTAAMSFDTSRVTLPICARASHHNATQPFRSLSSISSSESSTRLNDMVNASFHEHRIKNHHRHHQKENQGSPLVASSSPVSRSSLLASPQKPRANTGTTLHALANESVTVLHDFRHVNGALLRSQQSFGGNR